LKKEAKTMLFVVSLIAAALAWLFGWRLFVSSGLPGRRILSADVGSSFPQPVALRSRRYRATGKPDYLVRVEDGLVPVEVKSGRSPLSGRPYEGHVFQLAGYCLLVEDLYRAPVPYGLIRYDDRTIRVEYTRHLRTPLLEVLDEIRLARRGDGCHISHTQVGRCRSCGFRSVCGESLI
jgi:CRISPR-associated exonuclease Cas4